MPKDLKVLDVGSAAPRVAQHIHSTCGCEAHTMDAPSDSTNASHFGLQESYKKQFPNIPMHYCLAGDDKLEAESFDVILCISAIEHTYDKRSPMSPSAPLAHIEALRDMCRMLKPGGLLLFNWDTYLDGVPHQFGWDYLTDIWLMQRCGMVLADARHPVRGAHHIYNDPDTLFFAPKVVAGFSDSQMPHGTSINAILMKPGAPPRAKVKSLAHPEYATTPNPGVVQTPEMERRFRAYRAQAQAALSRPLL
jgi:SAM-dependent methyltransferase